MSDELVKRHVEQLRMTGGDLADLCQPLADAIEALTTMMTGSMTMADMEPENPGPLLKYMRSRNADRIEQLTAERDRLREALNQSRLAFAGHVSVQSAIDMIDRAALKGESHE